MQFSNATVIHSICIGISLLIMDGFIYYMSGIGLIVTTSVLKSIGTTFLWVGIGIIVLFVILFIVSFQVA
jgi:hypothetical protein